MTEIIKTLILGFISSVAAAAVWDVFRLALKSKQDFSKQRPQLSRVEF